MRELRHRGHLRHQFGEDERRVADEADRAITVAQEDMAIRALIAEAESNVRSLGVTELPVGPWVIRFAPRETPASRRKSMQGPQSPNKKG